MKHLLASLYQLRLKKSLKFINHTPTYYKIRMRKLLLPIGHRRRMRGGLQSLQKWLEQPIFLETLSVPPAPEYIPDFASRRSFSDNNGNLLVASRDCSQPFQTLPPTRTRNHGIEAPQAT